MIQNYAYKDRFGRETVTWVRTFYFGRKLRRFDATMIYSEGRKQLVDYLGTHQHIAADIDLSVTEQGGIHLVSGEQRFYEGRVGFRFPLFFSGVADVHEWYDQERQKFMIEVHVNNRFWGPLFGYRGSFDVEYIHINPEDIPSHVRPIREEVRE